jgi:RNA polymerase sigma-70 factor (ECF subfamily)
VRHVLGRLAGDQQAVLLLRILGDLTVEEVARVLGKRVGAVKALQRRGLAAAQRELESEGVAL